MSSNVFYKIPKEDRKIIFEDVSTKRGIPPYAAEKDWWVVQVLAIIFDMEVGKHLIFKGGTSLSKAWGIIERFSEDIDLAIDRSFLGFGGELNRRKRTDLRKKTSQYIAEIFYPELKQRFIEKGFHDIRVTIVEPASSDQDPRIIEVYYPNVIPSLGYIQPRVQIEIGCRSLREPFSVQRFCSLVDEEYTESEFVEKKISVPTVHPERTFLEKIFLLHEEFQRPEEKIRVDRLSRHLYDVYQLSKTIFAQKALSDKDLYETIVNHRYHFTKLGGVDYNLHQPQTINPIPPQKFIDVWEKDYKTMQEQMIYGESPSFDKLLEEIKLLRERINNIEWKIEQKFPVPNTK